jgi:pSer/pThr/pTyr-binding forkhead associated (FHA) protein
MPAHEAESFDSRTAEHEAPRPAFGAPYVWVLAVIDGDQPNAVHRILQYETLIGRGGDAQIDVNDEKVSKRHCLIRVEGAVCTIQDLGSRNGTRVNGRKMRDETALRLRHLDEIQIGDTRLFVLHGAFKRLTPQ